MKKSILTIALFALVLASCEGGAAICAGPDCVVEICDNGIDDDGNSFIDCADEACVDEEHCQNPVPSREDQVPGLTAFESCSNNIDDDEDGRIDCADPDCFNQPVCRKGDPEICDNGIDDDGNGFIDCADEACADEPVCQTPGVEICTNGIDDDGDGRIDCADPDCADAANCQVNIPEDEYPGVGGKDPCADGVDNDGDGRIDCEDSDCSGYASCSMETNCTDRMDNDGDGLIDCADPDCAGDEHCIPEDLHDGVNGMDPCADGVDNDADGSIDCEDSDCNLSSHCNTLVEICDNGLDDDEDGLVDFLDPDCSGNAEHECNDGIDNDGDGYVDCYDHDCAGADVCRASQASGNDYMVLLPGTGTTAVGCDGTDGYGWTTTCTGKETHGNHLKNGVWAISYSSGTCSPENIDHRDFSAFQVVLVDSPLEAGSPDLRCYVGCTEGTQANAAFSYNSTGAAEIATIFDSFKEVPCTGLVVYRNVTPF